ncbi:MAG: DEAD/DEAH box helicase, partial [Candidatus Omnitrophota bacterium]
MIYDTFQQKAIDIINSGQSVLVSAPTGAGKTAIAEHVILRSLQQGSKVVYTAPIKALSNQKYRDFQSQFQDSVGILTGDVSIHPHASTLIMTTEIFRNKIVEDKKTLRDYSWVIFDEIHYLDDYERGTVWEEALILMPDHMNILGLSATVPNIEQLGRWLESVHGKPVRIVKEHKRPVPLHFFYQCQNEIYDDFQKLMKNGYRGIKSPHPGHGFPPRSLDIKPNRLSALIKHLKEKGMLPCIYFVFSRKRTEYLAEELQHLNFLNSQEEQEVRALYNGLCERFELTAEISAAKLRPFVERGIAYHHAGMLPTLKEVVERLFTSRLIKVIFTTETFALGINMPARTVVFDEMRKFYGRSFSIMKTRDFYQMAGRAGRRSIDQEGFVFCRINPFQVSPRNLHDMIHQAPEQVSSRFNLSYATILNLFKQYQEHM